MPRKKKGADDNKSELIRTTFDALGPGGRPRDVYKSLMEQGHEVSRALISNVLKRHTGGVASSGSGRPGRPPKKGAKKRGRPAGSTKAKSAVPAGKTRGMTMEALKAAKKFAQASGGIAKARKALDVLESLNG